MRTRGVACTKAKRSDVLKVNDKEKQPLQQEKFCVSGIEKRMPVMMDLIRFSSRNMSCVNGSEKLYNREVM